MRNKDTCPLNLYCPWKLLYTARLGCPQLHLTAQLKTSLGRVTDTTRGPWHVRDMDMTKVGPMETPMP